MSPRDARPLAPLVGAALLALLLASGAAAQTVVKPKMLVIFDTSGSMTWSPRSPGACRFTCPAGEQECVRADTGCAPGIPCGADGRCRPYTYGDGSVSYPGVDVDGNGRPDDSRLYIAKEALATVLAARALGPDNVRVLLMPSQFSSGHSIHDARQLAENLGIQYDIIPIEGVYNAFAEALKPQFWGQEFNIAEENLQARARGNLLMAMSNKFGNILLNTSNKSEAAVGYGTLYGDMCGGLSVIGDLYKTEVFEMARYINRDEEVIPENTITKPPSAELRPNQKDTDSLPPYEELDEILFQYIEKRKSPQDIIEMGYEEKLVRRVLRLVNINEFKRHQMAPVLRVSDKAFGMGRRMPIVGKYLA